MIALAIILFFAGPVIGALAARLSFAWPDAYGRHQDADQCQKCGASYRWFEVLPAVSSVMHQGRCPRCGAQARTLHVVAEGLGLFVPVTAWLFAPEGIFILSCLIGWTLLALAITDWRVFILPDAMNAVLVVLGAAFIVLHARDDWLHHLAGGLAGFLILFSVEVAYKALRGQDGLGRGDAKLLGGLGLWLGWTRLPEVLLFASAFGLTFALLSGRSRTEGEPGQTPLAFGPWLALGAWTSWLAGPLLVSS